MLPWYSVSFFIFTFSYIKMSFQLALSPEKMPQIGKLKMKAGDVRNAAKTR